MFGIQSLPSGDGAAGEALAAHDAAQQVARRVALRAMARPVDQIGAAIPLRILRCIGPERLAVEEQQLPAAQRAADVERERHVVVAHPALHRRQRLEIGEQVAQILVLHALVRRVGKRGKIMPPVRRGSLHHRGDELRLVPLADAVVLVGRDIGNVERAERRFQSRARRRAASCRPGWAWRGTTRSRRRRTWSCRCRDSGVCGPSALAGTVPGMVSTQNAARPTIAAATASRTSLRSIRALLAPILVDCRAPKSARAARPTDTPPSISMASTRLRSGALLAIGVVAAAAVLPHRTDVGLQAVEIGRPCRPPPSRRRSIFAILASKSALFSQIAGSAAVSPVLRAGHEMRPDLAGVIARWSSAPPCLGDVERLLAVEHLGDGAVGAADALHHALAGGDRISLRDDGGRGEGGDRRRRARYE